MNNPSAQQIDLVLLLQPVKWVPVCFQCFHVIYFLHRGCLLLLLTEQTYHILLKRFVACYNRSY